MMSDNLSVSSASNDVSLLGNACSSILVEEMGTLNIFNNTEFKPRRIVTHKQLVALLSEDNRLMLGHLRQRDSDSSDFYLAHKSLINLANNKVEERRYLDLAFMASINDANCKANLVFLAEKKNKERVLLAHRIVNNSSSKSSSLVIEETEFSSYDKVNVLGKGVSHICSPFVMSNGSEGSASGAQDFFTVSNLLRKCRLESSSLKPTSARVALPTESSENGVMAVGVQNNVSGSGKSASNSVGNVVCIATRTKAASARSKFMLEWFLASGKKDEIVCSKSAIRLAEDLEPVAILADPKEMRSCYLVCTNRGLKTSFLFKISKGTKQEEPIQTMQFPVDVAAIGLSDEGVVTLMLWDSSCPSSLHLLSVQKSEGFRVRHALCADCVSLHQVDSSAHVVSCVKSRWRLELPQFEVVAKCGCSLALVTLVSKENEIVAEPETGSDYRVRIVGCETQGFTPVAILLDDLDRVFEHNTAELSSGLLKICLNSSLCRDSLSLLSSWLMAGRIGAVEIHYLASRQQNNIETSGSDRLVLKEMALTRFRSILTDVDWTQNEHATLKRQNTFTKDVHVDDEVDNLKTTTRTTTRTMSSSSSSSATYATTCSLSVALDEARKTDDKLRQDLERIQRMVAELQQQQEVHKSNTVE